MITVYISSSVVAEELSVTSSAVSNWTARGVPGMPAPDAEIRHRKSTEYVWLKSRLPEIRAWYAGWKEKSAEYELQKAEQLLQKAQERIRKLKGES